MVADDDDDDDNDDDDDDDDGAGDIVAAGPLLLPFVFIIPLLVYADGVGGCGGTNDSAVSASKGAERMVIARGSDK